MNTNTPWLDAAYQVLQEENRPLHYDDIIRLIYERGYRTVKVGKKASLYAFIQGEIKSCGEASRFCKSKTPPATFELNPNPTPRNTPPKSNVSQLPAIIVRTLDALKVPSSAAAVKQHIVENNYYQFTSRTNKYSVSGKLTLMFQSKRVEREGEKGKYLYFLKK